MYRVGDLVAWTGGHVGKVVQTWSDTSADGILVNEKGRIHRIVIWVSRHADISLRRQVVHTQRLLARDLSPKASVSSYSGPDDRSLEFAEDFADLRAEDLDMYDASNTSDSDTSRANESAHDSEKDNEDNGE